jgi:hypothetical protein
MATARNIIADAIKADNPPFIVRNFPELPENVPTGKAHVSVWRDEVKTVDKAPNVLEHPLVIQVISSVTSGSAAEDAADDALDAVLLSLQRIEGLTWTSAERMDFAEAFVGYKISASVFSENVYLSQVLKED